MKLIGKIKEYNGEFGTIITKDSELIDFDLKDISFNQKISINDLVEFRLEIKFPNIKIARNINLISQPQIGSE